MEKVNKEFKVEMKNQIGVYAVNTKSFYMGKELELDIEINKAKAKKEAILDYIVVKLFGKEMECSFGEFCDIVNFRIERDVEITDEIKEKRYKRTALTRHVTEVKNSCEGMKFKGLLDIQEGSEGKFTNIFYDYIKEETFHELKEEYDRAEEIIKENSKQRNSLTNASDVKRVLNEDRVSKHSIVAVFDSYMLRVIGDEGKLNDDGVCEDIIIVAVKHNKMMEQLIEMGFDYKGQSYKYYTSSAGQIRDKKLVMIKESVWNKHKGALTCGLDLEDINAKEFEIDGEKYHGCNVNKYLAYLALTTSASTRFQREGWKFDINKCIVIDDFEKAVTSEFDYIDKETFFSKREELSVAIEHSDGCGMMLPSVAKKNMIFRAPWMKGLLTPVNFLGWAEENNGENYEITDIYGKTWDLKEDGIEIIFTKSMFKMAKYYKDWAHYQENFVNNECHASICAVEVDEENFSKARTTYQVLQTLDMTDQEIRQYTDPIKNFCLRAYKDRDTMLSIVRATKDNTNRTAFQDALMIYPELLRDEHSKEQIGKAISRTKKKAKSGKFKVDAMYSYVLPDVVAWLEAIFKGNDNVVGALEDGEVFFSPYKEDKELDLLRSPHLYREHAIRKNVAGEIDKDKAKWFLTNGVYVSSKDTISKLLQMDWDGDALLVLRDKIKGKQGGIITAAKRCMKDIVPLYYEMGMAKPEKITEQSIVKGLKNAFKYGNIGEYSNRLTALWNSENPDMDVIKATTALNNYSIDAAKTLEMPSLTGDMKIKAEKAMEVRRESAKTVDGQEVTEITIEKLKMPYFFNFAKEKYNKDNIDQGVEYKSTMNRICAEIETIPLNQTYDFSQCGTFRKTTLMSNAKIKLKDYVVNRDVIDKYDEIRENKRKELFVDKDSTAQEKYEMTIAALRDEFKAYCEAEGIDYVEAIDMIIYQVFTNRKGSAKTMLFDTFGDVILDNLKRNINKSVEDGSHIMCQVCGTRVKKTGKGVKKYCTKCAVIVNKQKTIANKAKSKIS